MQQEMIAGALSMEHLSEGQRLTIDNLSKLQLSEKALEGHLNQVFKQNRSPDTDRMLSSQNLQRATSMAGAIGDEIDVLMKRRAAADEMANVAEVARIDREIDELEGERRKQFMAPVREGRASEIQKAVLADMKAMRAGLGK